MAAKFGGELWRQTARGDADGELCQVVDHLRVVSAFAFLRDFVCIKHLFVFLDISCFCFTCLHVRVIFLFMVHLIYKGYLLTPRSRRAENGCFSRSALPLFATITTTSSSRGGGLLARLRSSKQPPTLRTTAIAPRKQLLTLDHDDEQLPSSRSLIRQYTLMSTDGLPVRVKCRPFSLSSSCR